MMATTIKNILKPLLHPLSYRKYRAKQRNWQTGWSKDDFAPSWQITADAIPKEIARAIDEGWFKPKSRILDIGCGSAEITAYLANQGFNALGIDYAEAAIAKAKRKFGELPTGLSFKAADICRDPVLSPSFDALLDRGCFHTLPKAFHTDYANNVASYAAPHAHFLLLCKIVTTGQLPMAEDKLQKRQKEMKAYLPQIFAGKFDIIKIETTLIERKLPDHDVPALAVYLRRI